MKAKILKRLEAKVDKEKQEIRKQAKREDVSCLKKKDHWNLKKATRQPNKEEKIDIMD